MIDNSTISAIVFIFNEEQYISQMIDSIVNQSVKVDKIIIVDDFSTDRTVEVVERYQTEYAEIELIRNSKKGKVYALEAGLQQVSTDLFFVCAGDDVLERNYVQYLYQEMLKKHRIDFCHASFVITDGNLHEIEVKSHPKLYYTSEELLYANYVGGYIFGYRHVIDLILPFPEGLSFEDWFTNLKLSQHYSRFYVSPVPLFKYRVDIAGIYAKQIDRRRLEYKLKRELDMYEKVAAAGFITDPHRNQILNDRIALFRFRVNLSFGGLRDIFFRKHISPYEKVKMLFYPLLLKIKYK